MGEVKALNGEVSAFCLTENGDQLSQWRAYGRSAGYSLGFRTTLWKEEDFTSPAVAARELGSLPGDPRLEGATHDGGCPGIVSDQ